MKNTEIINQLVERDVQLQESGATLGANNANVIMTHSLLSADAKGHKGMITMGIDPAAIHQIAAGRKFVAILYLLDHDEYHKLAGNIPT